MFIGSRIGLPALNQGGAGTPSPSGELYGLEGSIFAYLLEGSGGFYKLEGVAEEILENEPN